MKIQLQIEKYEDCSYFYFSAATLIISSFRYELNFEIDDELYCREISNSKQLRILKDVKRAKDIEYKIFEITKELKKELREATKFL